MDIDGKLMMAHDRAEQHAGAGEADKALSLYLWLVERVPGDFRHRVHIARQLHALGEDDRAAEVLQAVARQSALCGRLMRTVATCKLGLATFPDRREEFEELLLRLHRRARMADQSPMPPAEDTAEIEAPRPEGPADPPPPPERDELPALIEEAHRLASDFDTAGFSAEEEGDVDLSAMPFFSDLTGEAFVEVVEAMKVLEIDEGSSVIAQGDAGASFFLLVRGEVVVERIDDEGHAIELAHLFDGALFGEMALLSRAPRSANIRAVNDCELFEVPREVLDDLIGKRPNVAHSLVEFTKRRLLANLVATSALFSKFNREDRREILSHFDSVLVEQGEVIVKEGQDSGGLFLISSGEVEVSRWETDDPDAETIRLAILGPGEVFGEISLIKNQPATATVMAMDRAVLLKLDRRRFLEVAMQYPPVLEYLEDLTEERLTATEEIMSDDWVYGADDLVMV